MQWSSDWIVVEVSPGHLGSKSWGFCQKGPCIDFFVAILCWMKSVKTPMNPEITVFFLTEWNGIVGFFWYIAKKNYVETKLHKH